MSVYAIRGYVPTLGYVVGVDLRSQDLLVHVSTAVEGIEDGHDVSRSEPVCLFRGTPWDFGVFLSLLRLAGEQWAVRAICQKVLNRYESIRHNRIKILGDVYDLISFHSVGNVESRIVRNATRGAVADPRRYERVRARRWRLLESREEPWPIVMAVSYSRWVMGQRRLP